MIIDYFNFHRKTQSSESENPYDFLDFYFLLKFSQDKLIFFK